MNTSTHSLNRDLSDADAQASIVVRGVRHAFGRGETLVTVLHDVNVSIGRGQVVILMGPSGSGKTTLLTLMGCLRSIQSGGITLLGRELFGASRETLVRMRRRLGFIFQAHNLHKSLSALENVRMGLEVRGSLGLADWRNACVHMLEIVGLGDRCDFLPEKLSGGQKQRVAVARALVGNPEVVFADEPTAALDKLSGRRVMNLLRTLADKRGTTVLIVTHDHRILDLADRIVTIEEGRIAENATTFS